MTDEYSQTLPNWLRLCLILVTLRWKELHAIAIGSRVLPPQPLRLEQDLWLSSIDWDVLGNADGNRSTLRDSITRAVELGANVIDTAANTPASERTIGAALRDLFTSQIRSR